MNAKNIYILLILIASIPNFLMAQSVGFNEIPLYFASDNSPLANANIENHEVSMVFDSGAFSALLMKEELLSKLKGVSYTGNVTQRVDSAGKIFSISEILLEGIIFNEYKIEKIISGIYQPWGLITTVEDDSETNITEKHENVMSNVDGVFGLGLFKNKEMIIDYPNKNLVISHDNTLPSQYEKIAWIPCSKNIDDSGITLNVVLNGKKGRFLLDTGTTASLLKPSFLNIDDENVYSINSTLFTEDYINIGENKFYLVNFSEPQVDGILGYNFFLNRIVYLDNLDISENKNGFCYIHMLTENNKAPIDQINNFE